MNWNDLFEWAIAKLRLEATSDNQFIGQLIKKS